MRSQIHSLNNTIEITSDISTNSCDDNNYSCPLFIVVIAKRWNEELNKRTRQSWHKRLSKLNKRKPMGEFEVLPNAILQANNAMLYQKDLKHNFDRLRKKIKSYSIYSKYNKEYRKVITHYNINITLSFVFHDMIYSYNFSYISYALNDYHVCTLIIPFHLFFLHSYIYALYSFVAF